MMRPQIRIKIPQEYIDNRNKGLCPVCGKPKSEFEPRQRVYCSYKCRLKYQKCFLLWRDVRDDILKRDKYKCVICGSNNRLQVDHIKALVNGGKMWDYNNLRTLCINCHLSKTKQDLYDKKYVKDGQRRLRSWKNEN